jgi:hypothetical protein
LYTIVDRDEDITGLEGGVVLGISRWCILVQFTLEYILMKISMFFKNPENL